MLAPDVPVLPRAMLRGRADGKRETGLRTDWPAVLSLINLLVYVQVCVASVLAHDYQHNIQYILTRLARDCYALPN